ncbi:MAG: hypothetical protein RL095_2598 [Verrucomicrobiota bacterium]|jgi:microcystin degradation protein MlrC
MKRIGIGGIAIESCTFSPLASRRSDFVELLGEALKQRFPFLEEWRLTGHEKVVFVPTLQAKAIPGGPVAAADYAALKSDFLAAVQKALPLDAFVFDLHGAMAVEGLDDAEADLAASLRQALGPSCRIAASMDLHGNLTPEFCRSVDALTAYRTAPHVDVLDTRRRACELAIRLLAGPRPVQAWVGIPVLLQGERTSTEVMPGQAVYAEVAKGLAAKPDLWDSSIFVGYAWADQPRCRATAYALADTAETAAAEAERLARNYWSARHDFGFCAEALPSSDAVDKALADPGPANFISDSGDNPTAGGAGDVPEMLVELLRRDEFRDGRASAIYASMPAPEAVAACFAAGLGARIQVEVGGRLDPVHGCAIRIEGQVESLFPDDPIGGDLAVLRCGGVAVILTEKRKYYHVISEFTKLGLDPASATVTSVKIGYLEPELKACARRSFLALSAGAVDQDTLRLPYRRISRPMFPLDQDFEAMLKAQVF